MTSPQYSKPVRLAAAALHAAQARKWDTATAYVQRISDECGGEGIYAALIGWCDTYIDHAFDGIPAGARTVKRMAYVEATTGALDDADSQRLPDEVRWAGQLIEARAAMDHGRWAELIDAMPPLNGPYVGAVLLSVADTINGFPRGFADPRKRRAWADAS